MHWQAIVSHRNGKRYLYNSNFTKLLLFSQQHNSICKYESACSIFFETQCIIIGTQHLIFFILKAFPFSKQSATTSIIVHTIYRSIKLSAYSFYTTATLTFQFTFPYLYLSHQSWLSHFLYALLLFHILLPRFHILLPSLFIYFPSCEDTTTCIKLDNAT